MNRAEQLKLQQKTNQQLINIRLIQLNYYLNLYTVFSIQALFIVASTYDTFSQEKIDYNDYQATTFVSIYYFFFAILVGSGFQVILCTMSLRIYGSGLALYGKLGSMAIAIEGMRLEQDNVIICFIFMMISFAIMTIFSFWFTMEFDAALSCTIMMIILSLFWYSSCERIYLRFYWNKEDIISWHQVNDSILDDYDDEPKLTTCSTTVVDDISANNNNYNNHAITNEKYNTSDDYNHHDKYHNNDDDDAIVDDHDDFDYVKGTTSNPLHLTNQTTTNTSSTTTTTTNKIKQRKKVSFLSTIYEGITMSDKNNKTSSSSSSSSSVSSSSSSRIQWSVNIMKHSEITNNSVAKSTNSSVAMSNRYVITEGYLSYKSISNVTSNIIVDNFDNNNKTSSSSTIKLKRHYFVLLNDTSLYIYKTKLEYRNKISSPYYRNPLKINEYKINLQNLDLDNHHDYDNIDDISDSNSKIRSTIISSNSNRTSTITSNDIHLVSNSTILLSARFQITMIPIENYTTATNNNTTTSIYNHKNYSDSRNNDEDSSYKSIWLLRMDTEEEMAIWVESMRTVSPNSFNTV